MKNTFAASALLGDTEIELKNIMLVGADKCLSLRDERRVRYVLDFLHISNIPIAKHSHLRIVNINYGDDFLTIEEKADVVVCLYIDNLCISGLPNGNLLKSPKHNEKGIWHQSALRVGAKMIFVFGDGEDEIGSVHFCGEGILKLNIPSHRLAVVPDVLISSNYLETLVSSRDYKIRGEFGDVIANMTQQDQFPSNTLSR